MMRKYLYLLLAFLAWPIYAGGVARMECAEPRHDFGYIQEEGGDVSHQFQFTNTGDEPLLIIRTRTNCGCTASKYPKEPIAPGESGTIEVTFSPNGRPGEFRKEIKAYTNAGSSPVKLVITGIVAPQNTSKNQAL